MVSGTFVDGNSLLWSDNDANVRFSETVSRYTIGRFKRGRCMNIKCIYTLLCAGSAKIRYEKESEIHQNSGAEITGQNDFGKSIKDMPTAIKLLLRNPTYILTVAGGCSEAFIISGFTAFLPKVIENQYNTTPAEAAKYAGKTAKQHRKMRIEIIA